MVKYKTKALDMTFGALADSTRRAILEYLAQEETRVTELAAHFTVSLPAVSRHLRVLENAGLLEREKQGRNQRCRLQVVALKSASEWLGHYQRHWEKRADGGNERLAETRTRAPAKASATPPLRAIFPLTKSAPAIIFNRSVKLETRKLDAIFAALADPTRRAVLVHLTFTESSLTELAAPFNISLPAFSKHLRVLEQAGLVAREKQGRMNLCRLSAAPMQDAAAWIARYRGFWENQFDALAAYLEKSEKGK
jgi:DNA-binding transcriptional ArsR family regulator